MTTKKCIKIEISAEKTGKTLRKGPFRGKML
jgi:hypothetical protein